MKNLRTKINWLSRARIQELLEGNGMAVYDSESTSDLEDTLFECVQEGDIPEEALNKNSDKIDAFINNKELA